MKKAEPHHASAAAPVRIGTGRLTLRDVVRVARGREAVADPSPEVERLVEQSRAWVDGVVQDIETRHGQNGQGDIRAYYGINTGFGAQAGKSALQSEYLTRVLSRNLIASHSAGAGEYFDEETVRAAMLIRAHTLAQGYSGVRPLLIRKLIEMLNQHVYPALPSKGSLGASGDLAPLSHLALVISKVPTPGPGDEDLHLDRTSGEAFVPVETPRAQSNGAAPVYHLTEHRLTGQQTLWQRVPGEVAMLPAGGQVELLAKEGLALNNGTTLSTALAALALQDAWNLLEQAELALSMTIEAIRGFRDPFFPQVHRARGHPGAIQTAAHVLRYIHGSELVDPGDRDSDPERIPPQDPYSVRCAPQVLGSVRDTLEFVRRTVETELNAATDNPLIFLDLDRAYKTVSCGNFHGEPIAMAMDFMGIAITELGSIAERRIFQLMDYHFANPEDERRYALDSFLIRQDRATVGLNSGLMIPQYTAAALVSECKTLAHPDSVDSIPTSANREDHVSMSLNAARHARQIVDNIEVVVAIECLCAAQALSLRLTRDPLDGRTRRLGAGTRAAYERIRQDVPALDFDRVLYPDARTVLRAVRTGELVQLAHQATKPHTAR